MEEEKKICYTILLNCIRTFHDTLTVLLLSFFSETQYGMLGDISDESQYCFILLSHKPTQEEPLTLLTDSRTNLLAQI